MVEDILGWVLGGMFLVWSIAYLLAHDTWQKVKAVWNNFDSNSSYPLSGAMGGAAICGLLAGIPGAIVGAIGGWFVGAAASVPKKERFVPPAPKVSVEPPPTKWPSSDRDLKISDTKAKKTKTKKEKVKKQSKTSKTSDTIVPPAPKKKPGRPRKSAKTE